MHEVVNYALFSGNTLSNTNLNITTISGLTNQDFNEKYADYFGDVLPMGNMYRNPYYDMTWACALALNGTISKLANSGEFRCDFVHSVPFLSNVPRH